MPKKLLLIGIGFILLIVGCDNSTEDDKVKSSSANTSSPVIWENLQCEYEFFYCSLHKKIIIL